MITKAKKITTKSKPPPARNKPTRIPVVCREGVPERFAAARQTARRNPPFQLMTQSLNHTMMQPPPETLRITGSGSQGE